MENDYFATAKCEICLIFKEKTLGESKTEKNTPEFYAKSLSNYKHPNYKILCSLRVSLTNQPVSWVQSFVSAGGLISLVSILHHLNSTKNRYLYHNYR